MTLLVMGFSHHSAPVDVLDRAAVPSDQVEIMRDDLSSSAFIAEVLVLSTCNRLEVVAEVDRFHGAVNDVTDVLARHTGVDREDLVDHTYVHFDQAALMHIFSVAAGIDSMVVGELQIVGQVRAALREAQEAGTAGRALNAVAQRALRVAKRVHSETGIDRNGASVVSVGLARVADGLGGLVGTTALVVGAGSMGSLAVSALVAAGVGEVLVANRTPGSARRLASAYGATPIDTGSLRTAMSKCDVVVTVTGSADVLVSCDDVSAALRSRPDQMGPLAVLDLALPRDTDPGIDDLSGAFRVDLSQLAIAPESKAAQSDVEAASRIVAEEVELFTSEQLAQRVEPVLVSLRAKADAVMDAELVRLRSKFPGLGEQEISAIERAWRRAVSSLLHTPTIRMKQLATATGGERYAEAIHALFDLDPDAVAALSAAITEPDGNLG